MKRQTTFVVLTTQRSGSGWLTDLLDDHPSIAAYAEMFRVTDMSVPDYGATAVPRFEVMVGPQTFSTSPGLVLRRHRYVRGLGRAHREARAVGFKLMYDQTRDHPGLMSSLALMRARFIHLVRRDALSAILSFDIAHESDRWHYRADDAIPRLRVRANAETLLARLRERDAEIERFRRRLARMPVPVLEITYEDLVERRAEVLLNVLDFLGVEPVERLLRSSLVRTTREHALSLVENRDEVLAALDGSPYESLAA